MFDLNQNSSIKLCNHLTTVLVLYLCKHIKVMFMEDLQMFYKQLPPALPTHTYSPISYITEALICSTVYVQSSSCFLPKKVSRRNLIIQLIDNYFTALWLCWTCFVTLSSGFALQSFLLALFTEDKGEESNASNQITLHFDSNTVISLDTRKIWGSGPHMLK